jgi:hypothetical protein
MSFFSKEPTMSKEPIPRVKFQSIFVRDHQRRLRLVIALLEEEIHSKPTPPEFDGAPAENESARPLALSTTHTGGQSK